MYFRCPLYTSPVLGIKIVRVSFWSIYGPFESCFVVRNNRIFYMSHIFFLLLWNSNFFYESAVVSLPICMTVSGTRWHLLSSNVFLINAVFCRNNIAGIKGSKLLAITGPRCHLLIRVVVTNPRCNLPIRGCQLLIPWEKKCSKQTQKRSQAIFFLLIQLGTMN